MSEFKYACPVCGQHIKCDSSQAGTVMDCPTCFQKITVPQAPEGDGQKFILTGTKADGKKTALADATGRTVTPARSFPMAALTFLLALLLAAGAGAYFFRGKVTQLLTHWQTADVGAVGVPGTFSRTGETLTVAGSGADIWGQADGFRYVYRMANGDINLIARVTSIDNTDPWAKAGLMVRESLAPESAYAMVFVTAGSGVAFQQRSPAGAEAASVLIVPDVHAPYWVRLARLNDTFTADVSPDGQAWTPLGSTTIGMQKDTYAGLAVSSHSFATLCQATFDHVAVKGNGQKNGPSPSALDIPDVVAPPANDSNWVLALNAGPIPNGPAAGRIHGQDFITDRAIYQEGSLLLRGPHGSEASVVINFSGAQADDLSGKSLNVTTNAEKAAKVTLRWKDSGGTEQTPSFDGGYALRLQFGALASDRLPGKIYLCLPDAQKSYLLGSFSADVRKSRPKAQ